VRASIMARKGLWSFAVKDIVSAAALGTAELGQEERRALNTFFHQARWSSFSRILKDRALVRRLTDSLGHYPLSTRFRVELVRGIAEELALAAETRQLKLTLALGELAVRVLGRQGICAELTRRLRAAP
jgi:hypothetical protein